MKDTENAEMQTQKAPKRDINRYPHSDITEKVIGCAIEVHKTMGPGFKESAYENALIHEFAGLGLKYERQKPVDIPYKGAKVGSHKLDLLVEGKVIVELKAVRDFNIEDKKRLLSYLKATNMKVGLLINFARSTIQVKRLIL